MSDLKSYIENKFNPVRPSTCIVNLKKNKNGMLDELIEATQFLDIHYSQITVNQRLFHYLNKIDHVQLCKYCESPLQIKPYNARILGEFYHGTCESKTCKSKFIGDQTRHGFIKKYGVENVSQTEQWREATKKTNIERYGAEYQTQSKNFKEKSRKTNFEKYGVPNYTQTQEYLDKSKVTCLRKYDAEHHTQNKEIMNKIQATNIIKYGTVCTLNNEEVRKKSIKTNLMNYGESHPMKNAEFFEKISKRCMKFKAFEFPSGRIEMVQGYEPFIIANLLDIGILEDDIIIGDKQIEKHIGKIKYIDANGISRRYYPDIYIISLNKVIEVKSEYTYNRHYTINQLKMEATIAKNLNFEFWIYSPKLNSIEII